MRTKTGFFSRSLAKGGMLLIFLFTLLLSATARSQVIKIDGSSTVYPISEAVAEEFQKIQKGKIRITIGISGTGGGFKKFCRGETDISNASRPISKVEMEACKREGVEYIEVPIAYDGIAVVVNPKNDWVDALTIEELRKMWEPQAQGVVTKWRHIRPNWPDATLRLFGPGVDSGTFDYFTEAVTGKAKASRADFTASEDDNVLVQGIAQDRYALGYFGLSYYEENRDRLKLVPIVNPKTKRPVIPGIETVRDGSYYPLSRPLFIYVNKSSAQRKEVSDFVEFYLNHAKELVRQVGYIPLPDEALGLAKERFREKRTGTVFGGEPEVGIKIEELLRREQKSKLQ